MGGEQLLVGGDDGLAGRERGEHQAAGRFDAADKLHDDVDLGVANDRRGVAGQAHARVRDGRARSLLAHVPDCDAGHANLEAGAERDRLSL